MIFNFKEHITKYAANVFLKTSRQKTTFQAFYNQVINTAKNLNKAGLKEKDIVVLINISHESFPVFLFALWLNKAIVFVVNPKFPDPQIKKIINESGARFYISGSTFSLKSQSVQSLKSFDLLGSDASADSGNDLELNLENPATIILTSGSSGEPKYTVHSLENHFSSAEGVNSYFNFLDHDSWLLSLPLFHIAGLAIIMRTFFAGATLCLPDPAEKINGSIQNHLPTHISLVPTQLQRLLENETDIKLLQRCKAIFLGGSAIPRMLIQKAIQNNLKLYTSYGLTELGSTLAIKKIKDRQTGQAEVLPFHRIKISNENEILLKGTCLFLGYLKNGNIVNGADKNGWFYSKDLGRLDNLGRLTVLGRKDNMFISGGENIYPEEIEKYLLEIEGLDQAVVVPVEHKEFGYRPVAFIQADQKVVTQKIKKYLGKHLPSFKIPDTFYPWPEGNFEGLKTDREWFKEYLKAL